MNDLRSPLSTMRYITASCPTRCFCPTYSSSVCGLILSGSGGSMVLLPMFSVESIAFQFGNAIGKPKLTHYIIKAKSAITFFEKQIAAGRRVKSEFIS